MGSSTKISWTDSTWSPLRARVRADAPDIAKAKGYTSLINISIKMVGHIGPHCEHVSEGCRECYSGTNNHRCLPANGTGLPFDRRARDLVEPFVDEKILVQPLKWKTPRRAFVENQSDLFGEWVPIEQIARVWAVMVLTPHITYQVLTKRPERAIEVLNDDRFYPMVIDAANPLRHKHEHLVSIPISNPGKFPAKNIWVGVSCEDQKTADARIVLLHRVPARIKFVSYEPALGPVDFEYPPSLYPNGPPMCCGGHECGCMGLPIEPPLIHGIHQIIYGHESGRNARPGNIAWAHRAGSASRIIA